MPLDLTYSSEWPALTSDLLVRKACTERNALTFDLVGIKSYPLIRITPNPRLGHLVMDQVPPLSWRVAVALTSDLLIRMASTHI